MKIAKLRVTYPDGKSLFDGLNLDLKPGSYTVICGPIGSGKSTLALALAGCLTAEIAGQISGGPADHCSTK